MMDLTGLMYAQMKLIQQKKSKLFNIKIKISIHHGIKNARPLNQYMLSIFFISLSSVLKGFLIISCILLATTFVIYIVFAKSLLNDYTKIMLQYCVLLFLSFLFFSINKFFHLGASVHHGFCQFTGNTKSQSNINSKFGYQI